MAKEAQNKKAKIGFFESIGNFISRNKKQEVEDAVITESQQEQEEILYEEERRKKSAEDDARIEAVKQDLENYTDFDDEIRKLEDAEFWDKEKEQLLEALENIFPSDNYEIDEEFDKEFRDKVFGFRKNIVINIIEYKLDLFEEYLKCAQIEDARETYGELVDYYSRNKNYLDNEEQENFTNYITEFKNELDKLLEGSLNDLITSAQVGKEEYDATHDKSYNLGDDDRIK